MPPGRIPAGHTLSWECPILLEANPGTHHRGCLARDRWEGLDATGKLLATPNPVLVSSPLLQGYWVFKTLLFQPLFQKYPGHSDCRLPHFQKSSLGPMHWALLESPATHPLMLLLPPWQVEHTGSLPWAGWARTPCSWNLLWTLTCLNKPELVEVNYILSKKVGFSFKTYKFFPVTCTAQPALNC